VAKMSGMRNIRPSQAQSRFKASHKEPEGFTLTLLVNGGFVIQDVETDMDFLLTLNERHQCDLTSCLVSCPKCPVGPNLNCANSYICTCRTYAEEIQCEHLHMGNILVNGIPALDGPEIVPEANNQPQPDSKPESEPRTQFPATTSQRVHSPTRHKFPNKSRRRKTGKSGCHGNFCSMEFAHRVGIFAGQRY
jgi:hypothetical protein